MNYQIYKQSLNQKLIDKVQSELADFSEETLKKSKNDIYDKANEIATKIVIADCLSKLDYSPSAARAMLKSSNLLNDIYDEWLEKDYSHIDDIIYTISEYKKYMVKTERIINEKER
ncbi:MAG: DUF3848 domain-containing protein [Eubacterium sp.]